MQDDESTGDAADSADTQEPSGEAGGPPGGVCRPSAGGVRRETPGESSQSEQTGREGSRRSSERSERGSGILDRLEAIQQGGRAEPMAEAVGEADADPLASDERVETKLRWEGPGKIVYEPTLFQVGPERYVIEAKRERRGLIPWGFWGGLLFVGVAVIVLAGAQSIYSLWDILWAMIGLTVGALLYRFGRKSTFEEIQLCEVDRRRRTLHWPEGAQSGMQETYLSFDDVTEIVFGMTQLPVDESAVDVRVDAFALLVRTGDEELLPVVEGSPYKGDVHEIAGFLAETTETDLTYVGRGIR